MDDMDYEIALDGKEDVIKTLKKEKELFVKAFQIACEAIYNFDRSSLSSNPIKISRVIIQQAQIQLSEEKK